jgi:hypothetical protein
VRAGRGLVFGVVGLALATSALAGCFADPTEVVVVLDTDAKLGRDYNSVQLCFNPGGESDADGTTWPVTVGVRKMDATPTFTVLVKLNTTLNTFAPGGCDSNPMLPGRTQTTANPFIVRTAKDVQFVDGQMRALFLPLRTMCACVDAAGMPITGCANALEPECADLSNPPLSDFDEDNLPHLPASAKLN